jgi:hypothetical protein
VSLKRKEIMRTRKLLRKKRYMEIREKRRNGEKWPMGI